MKIGFHQHTRPCALIIIVATILVYVNTFQVPFIFDDLPNIVQNPSIRGVPSFFSAFAPSAGTGIAGRPLINVTLALNYAISGLAPWSYHFFNLLVHMFAALALFGILRRTFSGNTFQKPLRKLATPAAFASALIWSIHPLQTQAVTYTIQRCESLMGLCFLLVFYFAIRGWQSEKQIPWHLASVMALFAGIGSKEVIVVAPVLLFYYDWLFVNKNPRVAFKRSPLLYSGLASGMVILGCIVIAGGTLSSVPTAKVYSAYDYWRTQPEVLWHYIRLAFWPSHLSLSYGWQAAIWQETWPACLSLSALLSVTAFAVIKRHPVGFPAVWFFLILSTTSIMPLPDLAFEHRMYLPLASLVVLSVTLVCRVDFAIQKKRPQATQSKRLPGLKNWKGYCLLFVSLSLCILTFSRNLDYRDKISIWKDAAQKYPNNSSAHANLGEALLEKGSDEAALNALTDALRIEKQRARHYSATVSDHADKNALFRRYLAIRPVYAVAHNNLGLFQLNHGNPDTALEHFQAVLQIKPNFANALSNTGLARIMQGRVEKAANAFQRTIAADPDFIDAYVNMGVLLRTHGRPVEAVNYFKEAIRRMPDHVSAHFGMAMVMRQLNDHEEAELYLAKTLRLDPGYKPAREVLRSIQKGAGTITEIP